MSHVHVHLHVSDLEASRLFYERFLGAAPVKLKPGYAKFLPDFAPINLALSAGAAGRGASVDHLGFQVESREAVRALLARVKAAGVEVREEMDTDCCYANQDKFWVRDPDGIEWEIYHLNHDLEDELPAAASTCCTPLARIGKRP
jgi:catechol 2,3-dioxygenase-like lactoylglutathione lyase family enzyme